MSSMNIRKVVPNIKPSESIYVFVRPYFLAFLPWIAIGLTLVILGVILITVVYFTFPEVQATPLGFNIFLIMSSAYFLLILPFLTVAFIDYYYDIHIVTDSRLIDVDQHSLFVREINELALEEVQDVTTKNIGILSSVFDFGTVFIETSSATQKFEFDNVRHPREIASIILDLADQAKRSIEGGAAHLEPKGAVKAVIDDKLYEDLTPLEAMGAVVPKETAEATAAVSSQAEPPRVAKQVEVADAVTTEAEVTPKQKPSTPTPKKEAKPAPEPKKGSEDLDIVIDDPQNKPKK